MLGEMHDRQKIHTLCKSQVHFHQETIGENNHNFFHENQIPMSRDKERGNDLIQFLLPIFQNAAPRENYCDAKNVRFSPGSREFTPAVFLGTKWLLRLVFRFAGIGND
jgi:hypothetical protein